MDGQYHEEDPDDPEDLFSLFVKQLNSFLMFTTSSKDKIKMWKFTDGVSKLATQEGSVGGLSDNCITFMPNKNRKMTVISAGNSSNKLEVFLMK